MINQLAQEYSNQPVVFVDYHFSMAAPPDFLPPQARWEVIQASEAGLGLTWAVVDSGRLHHRGAETTAEAYNAYTAMINDALAQPATAEIHSFWWKNGSTVKISATVTNNSAQTLSTANNAGVYGIVKEVGVQYDTYTTLHPGLNAAKTAIPSLAPGETATFEITVPEINPSNWNKVQVIVLVDYQTAPDAAYNQLQATIATPAILAQPNDFVHFLDDDAVEVPVFTTNISGDAGLTWLASSSETWLTFDRTTGSVGEALSLITDGNAMVPGWNTAVVTINDSTMVYSVDLTVRIYKASPGETINRIYLPSISRP